MSQRSSKASIRDIQNVIDETVVLLLDLRSSSSLTKCKREYVGQLVNELQKCSRRLPELKDKASVLKSVFTIVKKVQDFWKEFFGG